MLTGKCFWQTPFIKKSKYFVMRCNMYFFCFARIILLCRMEQEEAVRLPFVYKMWADTIKESDRMDHHDQQHYTTFSHSKRLVASQEDHQKQQAASSKEEDQPRCHPFCLVYRISPFLKLSDPIIFTTTKGFTFIVPGAIQKKHSCGDFPCWKKF